MSTIVSHDPRNPLSGISMCANVLLDPEPAPPDSVRSMVGVIRESARWMERIIQDLFESKLGEGTTFTFTIPTVGAAVRATADDARSH